MNTENTYYCVNKATFFLYKWHDLLKDMSSLSIASKESGAKKMAGVIAYWKGFCGVIIPYDVK